MPGATSRRLWESRARSLAWRINTAIWLERAAPACFYLASAAAVSVYALRRLDQPLSLVWLLLVVVTVALAGLIGWLARHRFFSATDARVLLESHLQLDTRLTAAAHGLVPWPPAAAAIPVVRWKFRACASWLAAAVILLALAARVPVPRRTHSVAIEKPPALAQAESMLGALAEAKLVQPEAIEQFEARARELAQRTTSEQYTHSALEAADTLRDQTTAAVAALSRNLDSASSALNADSSTQLKESAGRLAAALEGLREGALPANSSLLANLPNNGSALSQLSAAQRAELARQLAEASRKARGIAGAAGAGAPMAQPDPNGQSSSAASRGSGGAGGGESTAPLGFYAEASNAGDGKAQALSPAELSRIALSDRLGTTSGAPETDREQAVAPTSAGAVAGSAKGGEAVWIDRLTPTERAALKDFFK